jgi:hypothetical protein
VLRAPQAKEIAVHICIQDPANYRTYLIPGDALSEFEVAAAHDDEADVVFVLPSDALVQELPASRLTDSETPTIQILDTEASRAWRLRFEELERFSVAVPPSDEIEAAWFAMPSAKQVLAAVPVFRKALVQHSS